MAPHSHQTSHSVLSHGIPISILPHRNGGRVDLVVHLVMSNKQLELAGPSTISAASSIVIDGTLQGESSGNSQPQRQPISSTAGPHSLAATFPSHNQYTPPYTPGGSHAESTTFPLEVTPVESDVESGSPQVHASKGSVPDTPQHREVEYTSYRHNGNKPYYSPDMRGLSLDPAHRAASKRGRSPSPKSLIDDHEQAAGLLDRDVSITRSDHVRSQSSSSISGIESRRESPSRSQSPELISTQVDYGRGHTPPRMSTQPQSQWTRPASPVHTADASHYEENEEVPVIRAEGRCSLASRLAITGAQKKASTPTMPHSKAEVPVARPSPAYRFGKMRSEDYGTDGRQTRRRLQDRIDGNQTGTFGPKLGLRCPFSHRVNGANDCHDRNQPHPGYTSDEWLKVMDYVQRFKHAPPQLTKEGCVHHPAFKPPEGLNLPESFKPPESSQARSYSLNPFNMPTPTQGNERYIPPPTPPIPQQPPMAMPYPQPAPMPVPMPSSSFSSGPPPHSYLSRPTHVGASHPNHSNPFEPSGTFGARPTLKKRKIGPKGQFRPMSGDYRSQQAPSYQWPTHSVPPPNWSQQPPSNHPPVPMGRPHTRQAHRPTTFPNQQGPPPLSHPVRRKRPYDQL